MHTVRSPKKPYFPARADDVIDVLLGSIKPCQRRFTAFDHRRIVDKILPPSRTMSPSHIAVPSRCCSSLPALLLQIGLRRMQVLEGVLRSGEPQMQQLAGSIIDIDEQGAFGTGVLKPPVMRTDLDELA